MYFEETKDLDITYSTLSTIDQTIFNLDITYSTLSTIDQTIFNLLRAKWGVIKIYYNGHHPMETFYGKAKSKESHFHGPKWNMYQWL